MTDKTAEEIVRMGTTKDIRTSRKEQIEKIIRETRDHAGILGEPDYNEAILQYVEEAEKKARRDFWASVRPVDQDEWMVTYGSFTKNVNLSGVLAEKRGYKACLSDIDQRVSEATNQNKSK